MNFEIVDRPARLSYQSRGKYAELKAELLKLPSDKVIRIDGVDIRLCRCLRQIAILIRDDDGRPKMRCSYDARANSLYIFHKAVEPMPVEKTFVSNADGELIHSQVVRS